jgi:hypothetical protein
VEHLRGLITFVQRSAGDGTRQLLSAARHLEPLNASLPREMYLEALGTAIWADDLDSPGILRAAAEAARALVKTGAIAADTSSITRDVVP